MKKFIVVLLLFSAIGLASAGASVRASNMDPGGGGYDYCGPSKNLQLEILNGYNGWGVYQCRLYQGWWQWRWP